MIPAVVGIPIKPFGVAKRRLAPALDAAQRSMTGRAIARHTAEIVDASGAKPAVVTADAAVATWARRLGLAVLDETAGPGLNGAARSVVAAAPAGWAVLHADLPTITAEDLATAWSADGFVIAPSRDGGTSLIAGVGPFPFAYGPDSFHRHLAAAPAATVLTRPGLALDLDTPADLDLALTLPAGGWLRRLLAVQPAAAAHERDR